MIPLHTHGFSSKTKPFYYSRAILLGQTFGACVAASRSRPCGTGLAPIQVTGRERCPAACREAAASSGVSLCPGSVCSLGRNIRHTGTEQVTTMQCAADCLLKMEQQSTFTSSLPLQRKGQRHVSKGRRLTLHQPPVHHMTLDSGTASRLALADLHGGSTRAGDRTRDTLLLLL